MRRTAKVLSGAALVGGLCLGFAPAASAQVACDGYGQTCPVVSGDQMTRDTGGAVNARTTPTTGGPSTLPFTGGDIVLLSLAGAAAVAGGAALVAAGRRREPNAA